MSKLLSAFIVLSLLYLGSAFPFGKSIRETPSSSKSKQFKNLQSSVPYEEKYFEVDIDHFNFHSGSASSKKFQMRYLINSDHWDRTNAGTEVFMLPNLGG